MRAAGVALLVFSGCAQAPPTNATFFPTPTLPAPAGDDLTGSAQILLGLPLDADPADDYLLQRQHWVSSYNPRRLIPNWVAWRIVAADLGAVPRRDSFRADDLLPEGWPRAKATDYRGSGYDRGHLCPSADRTSTEEANDSTFLMTNMAPQMPALNRGPWESLEAFARDLVREGRHVQIVAGVLVAEPAATIGPGVAVPTAMFKVVVALGPGQFDATIDTPVYAVVMPNTPTVSGTRWPAYLVSVDEVERRSGYDLLRDVRDDVEMVIEARVATAP